jgi:drug/metabolite transporter (DMT)-like permease
LVPWYLVTYGLDRLHAAGAATVLLQAGYQGFMTGTVAMIAFAYAVKEMGAAGAAVFTPLTPVLATVLGWWLLGDTVDIGTAGGLLAVAIGVLIGNRPVVRVP